MITGGGFLSLPVALLGKDTPSTGGLQAEDAEGELQAEEEESISTHGAPTRGQTGPLSSLRRALNEEWWIPVGC